MRRPLETWEREWREVARRINRGEFDHADRDRLASVVIGLRSLTDAGSRTAMKRIERLQAELRARR